MINYERLHPSAYWIILTTFVLWSSRLKPVVLSFCLIKFDRIPIHSINNNDEIWHPCLTPRVKRNSCDKCPLFFINALGFVYRILIHCWNSWPMLNFAKILKMNSHSMLSKALLCHSYLVAFCFNVGLSLMKVL